MREIKQINTGVAEIIAVKVPEGASDFCVPNDIYLSSLPVLQWWIAKDGIVNEVGSTTLPPGNWTPLGIDTELTEEQCIEVVKPLFSEAEINMDGRYHYELDLKPMPFANYKWNTSGDDDSQFSSFNTAKEAFASLMQANGCYSVNPLGEKPKPFRYVKWQVQARAEAEWQQAEANTGTWLILVKK